ncbi:tensin-3 isoform X1 [Oncorhynchus kisutch]|uniref:tensin-3 isoform X1 n=2 Tax=Oncorhynchus kisutch TaxID=8019 RepID=UPI0012DE23C5|nr:tensin-3 isoform X1 [Oncorhynchus kisutch]XP_031641567.1 tensin-3 isoform X1 [Oncorhynchus kisutch]
MEEGYRIDLDYITERIITVSFPQACPDQTYLQNLHDITQMLKSKHGHNYMVINLSEKNDSLTQMNPKVLDTGWLDMLAPSMEQMYGVCKIMDNWLHSHTQHVLVMHCQGGQGRVGVMVASYIHFSSISASADLGLDHFAMRRFYNNKVSSLMNPSQKRYVWMFSSLLRGVMNMVPSPLFLLCVVLHGVPNINSKGGCRLFLRVYQSLQVVCTSAVYHVRAVQTDRVYFVLQPAQLLKGDIMVVCYNKNHQTASREVIFRLQFHTGIIHGRPLLFPKEDLDTAYIDPRFPDDGKVELVFSESPEKMPGSGHWQNGPSVIVDYDTWDPLVRRDSYEYISPEGLALPRIPGPVDGNLSARVRKGSSDEGAPFHLATSCPIPSDLKLSASKDSGLSIASQKTGGITAVSPKRGPSQDELTQLRRLLSGVGLEPHLEDITDLPASCNATREMEGDEAGLGQPVKASPSERESDILYDDEVSPEASIGSFSSESIPEAQGLVQSGSGYSTPSTQSWVQQQQIVVRGQDSPVETLSLIGPNTLSLPDMPNRGSSSRESVKRGVEGGVGSPVQTDSHTHASHTTHTPLPSGEPCGQEELASLATDIDESIEQLNQLILDLDPTFIPVPTRHTPLPFALSTSLYTNGNNHTTTHANASQSGWKHRQDSDVTDYPGFYSPGWGGAQTFQNAPIYRPNLPPSQCGRLSRMDSVDYEGQTPVTDSCDIVPSTPAFPISPPTPYVKHFPVFSYLRPGEGHWEKSGISQDSQSFLDSSMNQTPVSSEGQQFRSEMSVTTASCQRMFGSMRSVSSGSSFPHTDSQTPPPVWLDRTPTSLSSPSPSPSLSPLSLPNAHSSPWEAPRGLEGSVDLSRDERSKGYQSQGDLASLLLGNGGLGLEHSLLKAVEGLGGLDLGLNLGLDLGLGEGRLGGLPPLLPEKRVPGLGLGGSTSPSFSGFSSPHSGSSLSIPFPSAMTPDPIMTSDHLKGLSAGGVAPSPGSDLFASKQHTVKFVQDTSKFWYKPDISRDQAITMLKDREPGSFVVRDSHSFRGAYGLAMKVATPPPSVLTQSKKVGGDLSNELVRHFLIECTQKGVRLKGCPNEPYFGSLTALVCQHSITPLALPCKLIIPDRDPLEETSEPSTQSATNSAAELLKQGAACNVWFLGSVELESLTGYQAVQKAASLILAMDPPSTSTVVHFKVSAQGITLTDNQRKLFFRRHYTVNTVIFCALDPQERKWTRDGCSSAKIFGFVARKSMNGTENVCHLFAEHDPEQPASAIVNFVSKVMIGSPKK